MNKLLLFFITGILLSVQIHAQRHIMSFNDGWQFLPNDSMQFAQPGDWQNIHIPHTWNLGAYVTKNYKRGRCWYRKSFTIPRSFRNKTIYLRFDAINSYAEIYLNGMLIGNHSGGYSAFNILLPSGQLKDHNTIMILVDNRNINIPPLSGDFTIFGGIYRNTWMIILENQHFTLDNYGSPGIFISSTVVNNQTATLHIKGSVTNKQKIPLTIQLQIKNNSKNILSKYIRLQSQDFQIGNLLIQNPELWSPESPHLYEAQFLLLRKKKIVDQINISFGLRWFSADTKNGFMLNGKPLKLMGTNRHQDKAPYGIAVPVSVHWEDMQLIKNMGANFVRLAHYQQDDEVLKACDRLGLIVWEEIPVVDIIGDNKIFSGNAKNMLTEMIRQHYNHPSVMFWGFMNEAILQVPARIAKDQQSAFYKKTVALANELEILLKKEDNSRLSTMACAGSTLYNDIGLSNITDVVGWNLYQGWYGGALQDFEKFADEQHKRYPDKPIIISEFGAGSDIRLHSHFSEMFDFSIEYQQKFLEHYLPQIIERPYIIGAAEWNFIDFNVASRQESMPRTNNKGLTYNNRTTKDIYYYFQSFLRKDTSMVRITTRDGELKNAVSDNDSTFFPIKVYSNQPQIQININGKWLEKKNTNNFFAEWNAIVHKGENKIEAITSGGLGKVAKDTCSIEINFTPFESLHTSLNKWDIAINVGSNCDYFDKTNNTTWNADKQYTAGSWGYVDGTIFRKSPDRIGTTAEIMGTIQTPLFQTAREDLTTYRIDAPPGKYDIELGFADLNNPPSKLMNEATDKNISAREQNMFDLYINDSLCLHQFSPFLISGGNCAIIKKIEYINNGNYISISFKKINGKTFLNCLRIIKK